MKLLKTWSSRVNPVAVQPCPTDSGSDRYQIPSTSWPKARPKAGWAPVFFGETHSKIAEISGMIEIKCPENRHLIDFTCKQFILDTFVQISNDSFLIFRWVLSLDDTYLLWFKKQVPILAKIPGWFENDQLCVSFPSMNWHSWKLYWGNLSFPYDTSLHHSWVVNINRFPFFIAVKAQWQCQWW